MWKNRSGRLFLFTVACAGSFVWASGVGMPDVVAAHFAAGGAANGYMPRTAYVLFMLFFVIALPVLMVFITWRSLERPGARINLPNRDYWLAPERRAQTITAIRAGVLQFSEMLLGFLCYAHWLVVRANRVQPVRLDETWFLGGLLVFFAAVVLWALSFLRTFRRTG
jgi:hypothetical protein